MSGRLVSASIPVHDIAVGLAERIEALCIELLPLGHREGQEWLEARRANGGLGDSLSVRLTGKKRGVWGHFCTDVGGDALDLVAYVQGLEKGDAVRWAKSWLAIDDGSPTPPAPAPGPQPTVTDRSDDNDHHIQIARDLWRRAQPIAGTIGELYLRKRAISIEPPPTLRYIIGLLHKPSGLRLPALIAAVQGPDGRVAGVHRLFLRADGRGNAPVTQNKMMLGRIAGGAVRLAPAGPRLGIAEGIETGLSAQELYPGLPVWAVLSVSNMGAVALPETVREVVLLLDGDAPGSPADNAAGKAALELMKRGLKVKTIRPPEGKDFNDLLREKAPAPMLAKGARDVVA